MTSPKEMFDVYMDDLRNPPDGWKLCRTIEDTVALLEDGQVRNLSLDHDMGACYTCERTGKHIGDMRTDATTFMNWCPHADDGTKLVQWMVSNDVWPSEKPTVHSMNPVGAARMRGLIDTYWPLRGHGGPRGIGYTRATYQPYQHQ